ncbi:biotin-dependent carboxyltransferase family protein [Paenibacillus pabuli]|uniref:5-oxoprolinase subunit C family protein n=1 Tax=Paenibacillus pabuli TaxID=1472 RepID=UPI0007851F9B|nr:biotin-dependent carboxyltransferase family protein [Paenibacillus pabuli]MEC0126096.1 biotin-dependent carboxyltransferase family protein [Paenibacillus pabuli]
MSIEVIRPGLLSTIQDQGRMGFRRYGVHPGGVMDTFAARAANALVGNSHDAAVLEMTMMGPELRFHGNQLISLCGGDLSAAVDGHPVPLWRPVLLIAGSVLRFGRCRSGLRSYMAIAGGIAVPEIMGSRSTDLKTGFGGVEGRALKVGDRLSAGESSHEAQAALHGLSLHAEKNNRRMHAPAWYLSSREWPVYHAEPVVRVMPGKDSAAFDEDSMERFYKEQYVISPQSDRMGYRLKGTKLELSQPMERLSEAVTYGTVQVPADGQPIILMADHQTIGGYPVIAQVARVDLPILAQARPGARVGFERITYEEAQQLFLEQEWEWRLTDQFVRRRLAGMGDH